MQDLFREEACKHKKDRLMGEVLIIQPTSFSILFGALSLFFILLVVLLCWGSYARKETVVGQLVPSHGLSHVIAPNSGVVTHIYINNGDNVKKGDKLLTISTAKATDNSHNLQGELLKELTTNIKNIEKIIEGKKRTGKVNLESLYKQASGLREELKQVDKQLTVAKKQFNEASKNLSDLKSIEDSKYISKRQARQYQQELLEQELRLEQIQQHAIAKRSDLETIELAIQSFSDELDIEIINLEQEKSAIKQQQINIASQQTYTLYAPTSGKISVLQAHIGASIVHQTQILTILPENSQFEAHLYVPTRAVGFIKPDQAVNIRYTAFPSNRYGVHQAKITYRANVILSPEDTNTTLQLNEPTYRVTASLDSQTIKAYGELFPLQAGMSLEADIILDRLSLIEWLLDPLYSIKGRL